MIQRRRNYKKWLWWGGGTLLVVLVVAIGVVIWRVNNSEEKVHEVAESEVAERGKREVSRETGSAMSSTSDEEQAAKQKIVQYEGEDPNVAEELSGTVTYAAVAEDRLVIRVTIDQYLTEGSCDLTLSRGGSNIYSDTANIIGDVSTATCEGFDVSVGELGGGDIEININLNAGDRSGVIRGEVGI